MKISVLAIVLALAAVVPGSAAAAPQTAPASSSQAPVIKDPAEYNAYMGAIGQKDVNAKISGLEAFLVQYPNSVVKTDALESLLAAYQQAGNMAKLTDTANRLLVVAPDNSRALVILAYLDRANGKFADGVQHATQGLAAVGKMTKPDGMSDADFEKEKTQLNTVFNGVAGFSDLQLKNFPDAQKYLRAAVQGGPEDVQNIWPLALSYLTATPPVYPDGIFFAARAAALSSGAGAQQMEGYGKSMYKKYHGTEDGWADVMAAAKANPEPPAGFTIAAYVPPTPAQQCTDLIKSKEPKDMSFAEWELCLSGGTPEDSAKVWDAIKGKPLQMEGTVISASTNELQIAGSEDDIDAKRADIIVTPTGPIPAAKMPQAGATLDFGGTPLSFTPNPFVMTMEKGTLLQKAPPPPVHHHPAAATH